MTTPTPTVDVNATNIAARSEALFRLFLRALLLDRLTMLSRPGSSADDGQPHLDRVTFQGALQIIGALHQLLRELNSMAAGRGWSSAYVRKLVTRGLASPLHGSPRDDVSQAEALDLTSKAGDWLGRLEQRLEDFCAEDLAMSEWLAEHSVHDARALLAAELDQVFGLLAGWREQDPDPLLSTDDSEAESDTKESGGSESEDSEPRSSRPPTTLHCFMGKCERNFAEAVDCELFASKDGSREVCLGRMSKEAIHRGDFPKEVVERWAQHEAMHGRR